MIGSIGAFPGKVGEPPQRRGTGFAVENATSIEPRAHSTSNRITQSLKAL
jgi:hypothetical protein